MSISRATRPRTITKRVDFSEAAWNTVATHTLFDVSGALVDVQLFARTVTALTTGGAPTVEAGVESDPDTFYTADQHTDRGATINAIWKQAGSESTEPLMSELPPAQAISEDVVVRIVTAALTGGVIEFTLKFTPLGDAEVTYGDGA